MEPTSSSCHDETYENINGKRVQVGVIRPELPFSPVSIGQSENLCVRKDIESTQMSTEDKGYETNLLSDTCKMYDIEEAEKIVLGKGECKVLWADMLDDDLFLQQDPMKETDQNSSMNFKHDQVAILPPETKEDANELGNEEQTSKGYVSVSDMSSIEGNGLAAMFEHFELLGCKDEAKCELVAPDTSKKEKDYFLGQEIDETSQNQSADEEVVQDEHNKNLLPGAEENKTDNKTGEIIKKKGKETDPATLSRRMKQIKYGKRTIGYQRYVSQIPKSERQPEHPKTPPLSKKLSRRGWDGLIKIWRQRLHEFDPQKVHNVLSGDASSSPSSSCSSEDTETEE